jgi:hypothetical protein
VNVDWLLTTQGRLARIGAGTLLILIGLGVIGGFFGVILLIIGAIPIASAAYGALLIGPLFGRDTMGRRPEDQPKDESADEASDEDDSSDDDEDEQPEPEPHPEHEPAPLARAERPEGQEPRTRDPYAEADS